eukprot:c19661_g1_i3.p1 GENE.c19661_g1_i3~~c19661_g1_i3.p1  ORF type:complete len:277 (+),score=96.54 c19661_g1_i3:42-833(+)
MGRLRDRLKAEHEDKIQFHTPVNCHPIELRFQGEKMAKVVGELASEKAKDGDVISGLLVSREFDHSIMSADELSMYTDLITSSITQRQLVPFRNTFGCLAHIVEQMYENCTTNADSLTITVHDSVSLTVLKHDAINSAEYRTVGDLLRIEWESDAVTDMIADSLLSLVLQMESNPAVVQTLAPKQEGEEELENALIILQLLHHNYGEDAVQFNAETKIFHLTVDGKHATINHDSKEVECDDDEFETQLKSTLRRIENALYPLS